MLHSRQPENLRGLRQQASILISVSVQSDRGSAYLGWTWWAGFTLDCRTAGPGFPRSIMLRCAPHVFHSPVTRGYLQYVSWWQKKLKMVNCTVIITFQISLATEHYMAKTKIKVVGNSLPLVQGTVSHSTFCGCVIPKQRKHKELGDNGPVYHIS